jgi:cation transport regulator ChaC
VGMMYRIKDMDAVLPELDFREKNGYTRTVVDVWDPVNPDVRVDRAVMCV